MKADHLGRPQKQEHHRAHPHAFDETLADGFERELSRQEQADKNGVEERYRPGLGRREKPPDNPAQDDDRDHQPRDGLDETFSHLDDAEVSIRRDRKLPVEGHDIDECHHAQPDYDPRYRPHQEHLADGNASSVNAGKDQHRHAGRDDRPHDRGTGGHHRRETARISLPDHAGDQHGTDGRAVGNGHARHAGEKHAGHDGYMGQAAPEMAHDAVRQVDQPGQHAGAIHHVAGHDEEGDGHQRKGVDAAKHHRRQDAERVLGRNHDKGDAGQPKAKGHGHADRHGNDENED